MEFIVFSDTHYRNSMRVESREVGWLAAQLKATDQIFDYAKKNKVETIIFNGDLFDQKNRLDVTLYNIVWDYFHQKSKSFELIFNLGNHDMALRNGESSLKPFSLFAEIISEPTFIGDIHIVPYGYLTSIKLDKSKLLFTHEVISKLKFGSTDFVLSNAFDINKLKKVEQVFNGHIHKAQDVKNVINIGSLVQQNFGESGEEKRFIHYKDGAVKSIPITASGIEFSSGLKLNKKEDIKRVENNKEDLHFFKFDIAENEVGCSIFEHSNIFYTITKRKEREVRISLEKTPEEEREMYVELFNENLDKDKLLEVGQKIINIANEET